MYSYLFICQGNDFTPLQSSYHVSII